MDTIYFAYGSNLQRDPMRLRCPQSAVSGVARLPDWRFRINVRGYATIEPEPGGLVLGLLWQLPPVDERSLDDYEALAEGLYTKEWLTVVGVGDQPVSAMIYRATHRQPGWPQRDYLEGIITAAESLGFAASYLEELRSWLGPEPSPTAV